ncbi:MAG TPA: cytochrome c biogenesis protein CcdA [Burkholderiales bacterium]|nr:cytochrome c biogenesis protein CcdA [Burkholderiales bacterium]
MNELGLFQLFVLPTGLGLVGFIEPCSIGSSLLFLKYLENAGAVEKVRQTAFFAATRAAFIGLLGVAAVAVGSGFIAFQKSAWIVLGALYALLGVLLFAGRAGALMVAIGPGIAKLSGLRGSAGLGVFFGLNIPACAAPLLAALLAAAAATGASGATLTSGFVSLAVFGVALSAPLVAAVFFARARRAIDVLAHWAGRFPKWSGVVLIALGAWSVYFGLFVEVPLA